MPMGKGLPPHVVPLGPAHPLAPLGPAHPMAALTPAKKEKKKDLGLIIGLSVGGGVLLIVLILLLVLR